MAPGPQNTSATKKISNSFTEKDKLSLLMYGGLSGWPFILLFSESPISILAVLNYNEKTGVNLGAKGLLPLPWPVA